MKIKVYGKVYTVKTDSEPDLETVASYVDEKMRELSANGKSKMTTADLAVLTALNIAQELMEAKKVQSGMQSDSKQRLEKVVEGLEEKVQSIKTKGVF
ncbi:MAG: cell division protein ZapA [Candidatus Nitrohelix vancouverensis]|uniref:Cell division protein ZapA n=1 Tax=Candidatus Nitrohelix vancouverensis TaxID=2705534 RepID=A0A7T0G4Q5_9BACT|nr:MAG: cell division protein ZapA [Candidatus Nitrohelix vancouverensis]